MGCDIAAWGARRNPRRCFHQLQQNACETSGPMAFWIDGRQCLVLKARLAFRKSYDKSGPRIIVG